MPVKERYKIESVNNSLAKQIHTLTGNASFNERLTKWYAPVQ